MPPASDVAIGTTSDSELEAIVGASTIVDEPPAADVAPTASAPGSALLVGDGVVARVLRWAASRGLSPVVIGRASGSLIVRSLGMLVGFIVQTMLVRTIGRGEYGDYVYALAWLNVLMLVAKLEMDTLALRFVPRYLAQRAWSLLRGTLQHGIRLTLLASLGIAAVGAVGVLVVLGGVKHAPSAQIWVGLLTCILLPVTALLTLEQGQLQGLHRTIAAQAPNQLVRPAVFLLIVVVLLRHLGGIQPVAWHAVTANLVASLVALGLSTYYLKRGLPTEVFLATPTYKTRAWMWSVRRLLVISGAQLVIGLQSDLLVVGSVLGTQMAALYSAATQLAALVSFGATAVTVISVPMVAQHAGSDQRPELQRLLHGMAWASAAVTLPVMLGIVLFGKLGLGIFGPDFVSGYPTLILLSLGQLVVALVGTMGGFTMTMTGHEDAAARIIGASAVLNLLLSLVLTPLLGVEGTALATLVATLARAVAVTVYLRRRQGVDLVPLPAWLPGKAA